jgi:hypothetical protein
VQAVRAELESGEFAKSEHCVHTVAPATATYVPAPQSVHIVFPVVSVNFPTTHALHGFPFSPLYPALQAQAVAAVLELGEVELPGHVIHTVAPVTVTYVPAPHAVHTVVPVVPVNFPATHTLHVFPFSPM